MIQRAGSLRHPARLARVIALIALFFLTPIVPVRASWIDLASMFGHAYAYAGSGGEDARPEGPAAAMSIPQPLLAFPDPTISCSHSPNFTQGQMFRTYALGVSNLGGASTSGTVTVTDTLPAGLTAVSMGGPGWACLPAKLTCSRSDALAFNTSYPTITLSVNVASNAPATVTNVATVSASPDKNASNNTANDITAINPVPLSCGTFAPANPYCTNVGYFTSVGIADINGDGIPDLVTTHANPDTIAVFLGLGSGGFGVESDISPGAGTQYPFAIKSGDFDGDGKIDLVVPNVDSHDVSVLLGNGDGTFKPAVTYTMPTYGVNPLQPMSVDVADFNGDGKLDVVVGGNIAVVVMLGNGDGTFAAPSTIDQNGAWSVAAADFNGDGKIDLVASNYSRRQVELLQGNGDGSFATPATFNAGTYPTGLAVADFNGDGKLDVAVVNDTSNDVSVLLATGTGSFAPAVSYSFPGAYPERALAVGDFNGDGKPDLVVGSQKSPNVYARLGNGDGTFGPLIPVAISGDPYDGPWSIAAGDFDGDGKTDLVFGVRPLTVALNACSDMAITKSHTGNFTQGQGTNVLVQGGNLNLPTYTITVSNNGGGIAPGPITMTDALPASMKAWSISGAGWNCTLSTLTCTHAASFSPGATSTITLIVIVDSNAPLSVTNTATISGGSDINTSNNSAGDPTTINAAGLVPPTNIVAKVISGTQVDLSWDPVAAAASYHVYILTGSLNDFFPLAYSNTTTYSHTTAVPDTAYLYTVRSVDASGIESVIGLDVLATTTVFIDNPLSAGTVMRTVHLTQLRTAIDAVRATFKLAPGVYTDVNPAGATVKAIHIQELRSALGQALLGGFRTATYADPVLAGDTVKAIDFQELRAGVTRVP